MNIGDQVTFWDTDGNKVAEVVAIRGETLLDLRISEADLDGNDPHVITCVPVKATADGPRPCWVRP